MREFFRGWKRKVGAVTLLMVIMLGGLWFRGRSRADGIHFMVLDMKFYVMTVDGGLHVGRDRFLASEPPRLKEVYFTFQFAPIGIDGKPKRYSVWADHADIKWRSDWAGFHFGVGEQYRAETIEVSVPYWSFVTPLILLSAYLLLSKPRKTK